MKLLTPLMMMRKSSGTVMGARQIGGAWTPTSTTAGIEWGKGGGVGWMMERGNKRGGGLGVWTVKEASRRERAVL